MHTVMLLPDPHPIIEKSRGEGASCRAGVVCLYLDSLDLGTFLKIQHNQIIKSKYHNKQITSTKYNKKNITYQQNTTKKTK